MKEIYRFVIVVVLLAVCVGILASCDSIKAMTLDPNTSWWFDYSKEWSDDPDALVNSALEAKMDEYCEFYEQNREKSAEVLSSYYRKKITVPKELYKENYELSDEYVEFIEKANKALLSKRLSFRDAQTLFVFVANVWSKYVDAKGLDEGKEWDWFAVYFEEYFEEPFLFYSKMDEKLIGDLTVAFDPWWCWHPGAPWGNADRLEA